MKKQGGSCSQLDYSFISLALRLVPMLVKYSLNWFTILFLSVQQFPSEVINLSLIIVFCFWILKLPYSKLIFEICLFR